MSWVYNFMIYLAAPVAILVHLWRSLRDPSYRGGLAERFGFGPAVAGLLLPRAALLVGAGLKISYDLLLYRAFRSVRPPEER